MVAGGDVIGAGEWIVRKGKLWKISANSGHYRPTIDFLYRAVLHMSGAFQADTTVFLYDNVDDKWVDYPIRQFISQPNARQPVPDPSGCRHEVSTASAAIAKAQVCMQPGPAGRVTVSFSVSGRPAMMGRNSTEREPSHAQEPEHARAEAAGVVIVGIRASESAGPGAPPMPGEPRLRCP